MLGICVRRRSRRSPRALAQEAERHVEGGAAPAFEREELRQVVGVGVGDLAEVVSPHTRREQRLVRVPHGGVGHQHAGLRQHPGRHRLRPFGVEQSLCAGGGLLGMERRQLGVAGIGRRRGPALHFRVAVDGGLGDVAQEPARPVARPGESQ